MAGRRKKRKAAPGPLALKSMRFLRKANHWLIAQVAMAAMRLLRLLPPDRALDFTARTARRVGPWFGRHRTALSNLRQAYPEKSDGEIEAIALDMWGNMARLAAEYIFLDRLYDYDREHPDPDGRIELRGNAVFDRIAAENKAHILFTAHVGSFELLPIAAATHGLKLTSLFRRPNNPYIADFVQSTRNDQMGELLQSDMGAAFALAGVIERGGNVGMLVDQKFSGGLRTRFFGRDCETNPLLGMLARNYGAEVYPVRCIRLPANRYRLVVEERLELARKANGDIDVRGVTQQLNDVVERWVRENPGQWMWFHKRWTLSGRPRSMRSAAEPGQLP